MAGSAVKGTIAVALSGGVDSAVAAARLRAEGAELVGVTARLLSGSEGARRGCCDEQRARELCALLGIEHYIVDLTEEFARQVVAAFVAGYASGLTPNPCLPCNQLVKFGLLAERVAALGCDALATGHYVVRTEREGRWSLRRAADRTKDQSYMLRGLSQEQIARARFPLGGSLKTEVAAEAARLRLPASARESQDACFVPDDLAGFMAQRLPLEPGPILDRAGRNLGTLRGLPLYTVGQRRGLNVGGAPRLYVLARDRARNALVVGEREALALRWFAVRAANWVSIAPPEPGKALDCLVMMRYRGAAIRAVVTVREGGRCEVELAPHDQAVAPGQGAAFYDDEGWLLGGGEIEAGKAAD